MDGVYHPYTTILQCVRSVSHADYAYSPAYLIDWLDGGMICLAMFTMNIFHPGLLLGTADAWRPIVPAPVPPQADLKAAMSHADDKGV